MTEASLADANVPPRYWDASFRVLLEHHAELYETAQSVFSKMTDALNRGNGLRLMGPSESGKTYFAVSVLKEAMRRGAIATMLASADVISVAKREMMTDSGEYLLDRIRRSNVVVLDGLGAEAYRNSQPGQQTLLSFLNSIYDRKTSLILTTTLDDVLLRRVYSSDLYGKIRQMTLPVTFGA